MGSHAYESLPVRIALERVVLQEHVDDALKKGAEVACGGSVPSHLPEGNFYSPTLLTNATPSMRVFTEETFAPVIPLFPYGFAPLLAIHTLSIQRSNSHLTLSSRTMYWLILWATLERQRSIYATFYGATTYSLRLCNENSSWVPCHRESTLF